jgi:hypothetical protein
MSRRPLRKIPDDLLTTANIRAWLINAGRRGANHGFQIEEQRRREQEAQPQRDQAGGQSVRLPVEA